MMKDAEYYEKGRDSARKIAVVTAVFGFVFPVLWVPAVYYANKANNKESKRKCALDSDNINQQQQDNGNTDSGTVVSGRRATDAEKRSMTDDQYNKYDGDRAKKFKGQRNKALQRAFASGAVATVLTLVTGGAAAPAIAVPVCFAFKAANDERKRQNKLHKPAGNDQNPPPTNPGYDSTASTPPASAPPLYYTR